MFLQKLLHAVLICSMFASGSMQPAQALAHTAIAPFSAATTGSPVISGGAPAALVPGASHLAPTPQITPQSSGVPISAVAQYRQQYGARQASSGIFDGAFDTTQALIATLPDVALHSESEGLAQHSLSIAPSWAQSVEFNASRTGGFGYSQLSVATPGGTTLTGDVRGIKQRFTFAVRNNVEYAPRNLLFECVASWRASGDCSWSNLRFYVDVPGWAFDTTQYGLSGQTLIAPTGYAQATVVSAAQDGLAAHDSPFLELRTFCECDWGAQTQAQLHYNSPLFRVPLLESTDSLTMSLDWARLQTGNATPSAVDVSFRALDGSNFFLMTLPAGGTQGWSRQTSVALPPSAANKLGRIEFSFAATGPRIMGIDSLSFSRNGQAIPIPAD